MAQVAPWLKEQRCSSAGFMGFCWGAYLGEEDLRGPENEISEGTSRASLPCLAAHLS